MENRYELMMITRTGLGESDEKKLFAKISDFIDGKGKILKTNGLGKKQLSFRIKKESDGNYWVLDLQLNSNEVSTVSAKLSMEENIIRYLILKKEILKIEEKSVEKITKVTAVKARVKKRS